MFTRHYEATGKVVSAKGQSTHSFIVEFYINSFFKPSKIVMHHFADECAESLIRADIGKCDKILIESIKRVD